MVSLLLLNLCSWALVLIWSIISECINDEKASKDNKYKNVMLFQLIISLLYKYAYDSKITSNSVKN